MALPRAAGFYADRRSQPARSRHDRQPGGDPSCAISTPNRLSSMSDTTRPWPPTPRWIRWSGAEHGQRANGNLNSADVSARWRVRRCPRGARCSSYQSRHQSDMSNAGWVVIGGGPRNTATSPPAASPTVCCDHRLSVRQGRRDCRQSRPLSGRQCTGPCLVQYWCTSGPVREGASRMLAGAL